MQWKGLYKERNPFKKRDEHSIERERERERERKLYLIVKISALTVNEKSILGLARGRMSTELVFFLSILIVSILLSQSL